MWERYCRGVQAIVFVVDSADLDSLVGSCYVGFISLVWGSFFCTHPSCLQPTQSLAN